MDHTGLSNQCLTCHGGSYLSENAQTKSATHVPTTAQCDGCHKSTTTFATSTVDHSKLSPAVTIGNHTCSTCHKSGGSGLPMPGTHIPTTAYCDNCHKNFTAFAPGIMDHTGTATLCATCHNGSYVSVNAQAKTATHQVTTQSCDVCHSTTAWKPATFTHTGVAAGTCATCHGSTATGKPTAHISTTQSCDSCHRTTAWLPLVTPYAHTGIVAGTCATCHSSGYANIDAKPAAHIPGSTSCDACHRTSAWLPLVTPNPHTGVVVGSCSTCHTPPYTSIVVMPSNHIPTTWWPKCDSCHKSYTSFANTKIHTTAFTTASQQPGICPVCHENGNPYGLQGRTPSKHKSGTKATASCDTSGCHTIKTFSK
jgi:predicted CXXCH cytochrome family protein